MTKIFREMAASYSTRRQTTFVIRTLNIVLCLVLLFFTLR